eukprot:scaffold5006_cov116-Isochrysis_galbana.AAC.6
MAQLARLHLLRTGVAHATRVQPPGVPSRTSGAALLAVVFAARRRLKRGAWWRGPAPVGSTDGFWPSWTPVSLRPNTSACTLPTFLASPNVAPMVDTPARPIRTARNGTAYTADVRPSRPLQQRPELLRGRSCERRSFGRGLERGDQGCRARRTRSANRRHVRIWRLEHLKRELGPPVAATGPPAAHVLRLQVGSPQCKRQQLPRAWFVRAQLDAGGGQPQQLRRARCWGAGRDREWDGERCAEMRFRRKVVGGGTHSGTSLTHPAWCLTHHRLEQGQGHRGGGVDLKQTERGALDGRRVAGCVSLQPPQA